MKKPNLDIVADTVMLCILTAVLCFFTGHYHHAGSITMCAGLVYFLLRLI